MHTSTGDGGTAVGECGGSGYDNSWKRPPASTHPRATPPMMGHLLKVLRPQTAGADPGVQTRRRCHIKAHRFLFTRHVGLQNKGGNQAEPGNT